MILSNLQHFHFQMENYFPLATQKSETPQNQLLMFSLLSASALPPFPWLIHWDQLPKFLAQLKWQVSSHYKKEELDYRGIYLLGTAITLLSRADSRSVVPRSLKCVQPMPRDTALLSHSALGTRHPQGFHLLLWSPKSPPS